jgi:cytosine/adenosine deaminase-related metal-dependent hydrolase
MKKLSADFIFDGFQLHENAVLIIDSDGTVEGIFPKSEFETSEIEYYKGVLSPGFINAHCHLELSHLKNAIPEKTGLPGFIRKIPEIRYFEKEEIAAAIHNADRLMQENGIVAVGDIANTADTFLLKQQSSVFYHTFIEVYAFAPFKAQTVFEKAVQLLKTAHANGLRASIVPHAPYSVSFRLFELLKNYYTENPSVISIHNQETASENEMFIAGDGTLLNILEDFGNDISHWNPTGKSSVLSVVKYLNSHKNIIFVHNTFTSVNEIQLIKKKTDNAYWCLCPNANLYIENRLPAIDSMLSVTSNICIGTDSLASNHTLSVAEEIGVIQKHFPHIPLEKLLQFGTINGAKALKIEDVFGSFEKGKKPGVNLLNINDKQILSPKVKPLI